MTYILRSCGRSGISTPRKSMPEVYNASEQLRGLLRSDALGGMAMGNLEEEVRLGAKEILCKGGDSSSGRAERGRYRQSERAGALENE